MKITINTKKFAKELAYVSKMIISNPTNPLWTNVLIQAEGDMLRLAGTNGVNAVSTFITLDKPASEPFAVAINAKKITDIVKLIEQDSVNLSVAETKVTLTAGKGRYSFAVSPDAVSSINVFLKMNTGGDEFTADAQKFANLVDVGIHYAASEEKTKFTLMGVKVICTPEKLSVVSMNGQQAIDMTVDDVVEGRNASVFVPRDGAEVLSEIVDDATLKVRVNQSLIVFECGNRVALIRRSATENMPAISNFLDKYLEKNELSATCESSVLGSTVKRLQTAVDGKLRKIIFTVSGDGMKLNSYDPLGSCQEFEEEVPAGTEGTGNFSLNASHILDFTKMVPGIIAIRYNPSVPNAGVVLTNGTNLRCMISTLK